MFDRPDRTTRTEAAVIGGVLLLAASFRLFHLASLPPGLFQDEAINGVNAQTILGGAPRWYYGEREPLYMYVAALTTLLLGATPLALRLASALTGIVGVAAGGAFARSLFGRRVGLLASFGLAVSLWLVDLSRIGFRAITLPMVAYLGLALFWRATRTARARDYLLSGGILGLSLYTYLSARFLPFALVGFVVLSLVQHRDWLRPRLGGMVLAGISAFVVCVPLGAYALRHPEILFGRPDQVALPGGSAFWPALLANVPRVLGMLAIRGDLNWRHNLSGVPVFEALDAALFLLGVVVAFRWRKPETSFVLVLATVMLVPSMLSQDSPHYLRTIGASGALYALWGLGADRAARGVGALVDRCLNVARARAYASTAFLALVLIAAAGRTARDYFVLYARSPQLRDAYASDLTAVGEFLAASPIWNEDHRSVYLPSQWIDNRGSIAYFLYPRLAPAERSHWIDPQTIGTFVDLNQTVPLPSRPSLYVVPASDATTARILGSDVRESDPITDQGQVVARAIVAAPLDSAPTSLGVRFGPWLELESATNDATTTTLRWKVLGLPPYQPSVFVHLEDEQRHTIAQADSVIGLPVPAWRVGAEFVTLHVPRWLPGTPPGRYHLIVGVYDKDGGQRETAVRAGQNLAEVDAGIAVLADPVAGIPDLPNPVDLPVAPGLQLRSVDVPSTVEAGAALPVTLLWEAVGPGRADLQVGILLRSADGKTLQEWWGRPGGDAFPTTRWGPSQAVRQIQDLRVPPEAAGTLLVETTARVVGQTAGPAREIARVTANPSVHTFTPPAPSHPIGARFGGVGTLVGSDFPDHVQPGRPVRVVLYWRAGAATTTAETVFVHLLDAANHVVGQRDEPPLHGTRPTTGWVAGEYLTDPHDLLVDPRAKAGIYQIEVGMYDPRTGVRVSTETSDNRIIVGSLQVEPAASPAR